MRKAIFFTLLFISYFSYSQDEVLAKLSIDELLAIDLSKSSLPIIYESGEEDPQAHGIGMVLPVSKFKAFSKELILAAKLAIEEVNAAGGVLGKPLQLVIADDASESSIAIRKVDSLHSVFDVSFVIGPTGSGRFIDVVEQQGVAGEVLLISPSASSSEISQLADGGMSFRTAASDELQARVAADYAFRVLEKRKAAIFSIDNRYGQGLLANFRENFERLGGLIVGEEVYSPLVDLSVFDVSPRIEALLSAQPDIVYFISNGMDLATMSHVLEQVSGLRSPQLSLMATDAAKSASLLERSHVFDGLLGTAAAFTKDQAFLSRYEERFGQRPTFLEVADVYDIVYMIALGMEHAVSSDPRAVARSLSEVTRDGETVKALDFTKALEHLAKGRKINLQGASGNLALDENGDIVSRDFEIWQLLDGQFQTVSELRR